MRLLGGRVKREPRFKGAVVEATAAQVDRVFTASIYACAMLEAILVLSGDDRRRYRGWDKAYVGLRRALKAAGVPREYLTFRTANAQSEKPSG